MSNNGQDDNFEQAKRELRERWAKEKAQRDADWQARQQAAHEQTQKRRDDSRAQAEQRVRKRSDLNKRVTGGRRTSPPNPRKKKAPPKKTWSWPCSVILMVGSVWTILNIALVVDMLT